MTSPEKLTAEELAKSEANKKRRVALATDRWAAAQVREFAARSIRLCRRPNSSVCSYDLLGVRRTAEAAAGVSSFAIFNAHPREGYFESLAALRKVRLTEPLPNQLGYRFDHFVVRDEADVLPMIHRAFNLAGDLLAPYSRTEGYLVLPDCDLIRANLQRVSREGPVCIEGQLAIKVGR